MQTGAVGAGEVTDMVTELQRLALRFDADHFETSEVRGVITDLGQAKRLVDGMITIVARRTTDQTSSSSSKRSEREAAEELADATGTTTGQAKKTLNTSRRLTDQPDIADAVKDGRLSAEQADAVTDAVDTAPDAVGALLDKADSGTLADLKRACRDTKADADPMPDWTRERHRRGRSCRTWNESDGEWKAILTGPADFGARFDAALRAEHDEIFRAAHAAGQHEDTAAYRLDALMALLERGADVDMTIPTAPDDVDIDVDITRTDPQSKGEAAAVTYDDIENSETTIDQGRPTGTADAPPATTNADRDGSPDASDPTTDVAVTPTDMSAPRGATRSIDNDTTNADAHQLTHSPPTGPPARSAPSKGHPPNADSPDRPVQPCNCQGRRRRSGRETKVIVTIDAKALMRDETEPGDTCHIAGIGRVSLTAVKRLIPDAHIAYVIKRGTDVSVAHLGRQASARQRTALEARGYRCEVPGCHTTHLLEIDHVADWAFSHTTVLESLAWLCTRHHEQKSRKRYRLSGSPGHRTWSAPDGRILAQDPQPPGAATGSNADPTQQLSAAPPDAAVETDDLSAVGADNIERSTGRASDQRLPGIEPAADDPAAGGPTVSAHGRHQDAA